MTYPDIDNAIIWTIVEFAEAAKTKPELLTDNTCPYPKEFTDILRAYVYKTKAKSDIKTTTVEGLEDQIANLEEELDGFRDAINRDEEGQIFINYMRLRAAMLTKMIEIKERTFNLRKMKEFQEKVLEAVDKLMSPEQRTNLIKLLEGIQ